MQSSGIVSSLNDDIKHATDVLIVGKRVSVCFSVDLVVVCCLPNVAPSAPRRRAVKASRPIAQFGLHHWPSFLSGVVFLHEARAGAACFVEALETTAYRTMSGSCRNSSISM